MITRQNLTTYAPLMLVLALAAGLRLFALDALDVRFDEAVAPNLARGIVDGTWLLVAPFSGSVANHPPLFLYLLALPYLFTRDFLAVAAYRQLLDVAAVGLTWALGRRFFNLRVALLAALLFAVAPWAIQLSRKLGIVTPPLFTLVWLWGLCLALKDRDPRGWAWVGLGLALCVGAHFSAIYLVPVTAIAVGLGWRTLRFKPVALGLLPIALLAGAYLAHDAGQNFANLRALTGATGGGSPVNSLVLDLALWTTGGTHLSDLTGRAYGDWVAQLPAWLNTIDALQIGLVVLSIAVALAGVARSARNARNRGPDAPLILVLVLWQVLPVLLQLRSDRPPQVHYFMPLWPGAWLLVALAVDQALGASRARWLRAAVIATVLLVLGWQVFSTFRFVDFIQTHDTAGGYGEPIRPVLRSKRLANAWIDAGYTPDVVIVQRGGDPNYSESATMLDALFADMPRRFVNAEDGLILRGEPMQYVFAPGASAARARLNEYGPVTSHISPGRTAERGYDLARLDKAVLPAMRPASARWANGAQLLGTRAVSTETGLRVDMWLSVQALSPTDQHWFVRVLDKDGKQLSSLDTDGIRPSSWRVGDVLALTFDIPRGTEPGEPNALRIGSYAFPEIKQTLVLDAAGNPADDGVTVSIH